MAQYNFDEIIDRRGTHSLKTDMARQINPLLPESFIPLWVADMELRTAPAILNAMRQRVEHGIFGYTMLDEQCKRSVSRWMERRFGWVVDPDEIVFSSGIVAAVYAAVERLTQPGDRVVFCTPAYHPFDDAIKRAGRVPVYSRMRNENGRFSIDFDDLETKLKDGCKLAIHCSPHNPTGRVFTEEEQRRFGTLCFSNNVFVLSDEIHADLTRVGQTHIPLAKLFPGETRIITCTSPSKTFNLAANNHSHLMIPDPELRRSWSREHYNGHPSALSCDSLLAAYDESEDWLEALRVYLNGNFALMKQMLDATGKARFTIPEGTYLGWVDLRGYGLPEAELKARISRAGVFVQFGEDFVENSDCFMRVNVACPRRLLEEGLTRLITSLQD